MNLLQLPKIKIVIFVFLVHRVIIVRYFLKEKVNECLKGIDVENIHRNFLWEKGKNVNFLTTFYIFNKVVNTVSICISISKHQRFIPI